MRYQDAQKLHSKGNGRGSSFPPLSRLQPLICKVHRAVLLARDPLPRERFLLRQASDVAQKAIKTPRTLCWRTSNDDFAWLQISSRPLEDAWSRSCDRGAQRNCSNFRPGEKKNAISVSADSEDLPNFVEPRSTVVARSVHAIVAATPALFCERGHLSATTARM